MDSVKRIKRDLAYRGAVLDVYDDTMLTPDGKTVHYDFIHHNGAAAVVPVREDGKILMVRQFRNAIDRETIEIPAGKLDTIDEPGIVCASRELEEETGYRSENLEKLITIRTTVALCNEKIEIFTARNLIPSKQHLDADEYIAVEAYTIEELKEKILNQEIEDSKTIAAILAYDAKYHAE